MKIKFKFIFSLLQVQQLTDIANFKLMIPSLNGGFGIAFESGYDKCLAEDLGLTYDSLVLKAEHKASEYAELYPEYDVIFVKDAIVWSDGSSESAILIFLSWNDVLQTEEVSVIYDAEFKAIVIGNTRNMPDSRGYMYLFYSANRSIKFSSITEIRIQLIPAE